MFELLTIENQKLFANLISLKKKLSIFINMYEFYTSLYIKIIHKNYTQYY